ncbi:unnamed protein product [Alternaria alternata]
MWSTLVLPLLAFSLRTVSALPQGRRCNCEEHPVCIIGAGPAGLAAAGRLEEKGVKAVMFDRQAEVGGECHGLVTTTRIFHPLGAAFFSNATYTDTISILNQTNVSIEPFALAGAREMYRYNYTTGDISMNPTLTPQFTAQVSAEIPRNGVPDEFTVSGAEWFRQNNFTALPILLVNPVALYGYGDINIVPALYILQYFAPDILTAFVGLHSVYYMDFHKMFVEYAKNQLCKTPIHTSSEVRCVDRSGDHPILTYTTPAPNGSYVTWEKQECSSVIFAFPPNMDNLERIGVDLTEQEHDTFANITTHQYYSSAVELELPFGVSYIAESANDTVPPPNDGEPVAVLHLSRESNVSVAWSWGPYEFQTEDAARNLLVESLSELNKDPRNATEPSQPFCEDDVKAFKKWDYFPHFEGNALSSGAYSKLNKLQGQKKTYYASGLSGMEIVEWAIRGGRDVADTYF